jgi:hypothetical protein
VTEVQYPGEEWSCLFATLRLQWVSEAVCLRVMMLEYEVDHSLEVKNAWNCPLSAPFLPL